MEPPMTEKYGPRTMNAGKIHHGKEEKKAGPATILALKPYYTKDKDLAPLLYCDVKPTLELYSPADVCFVCDITGSMDHYIKAVRENLHAFMEHIAKTLSSRPRFAFIGYRDICDNERQIVAKDFTLDAEEIGKFIDGIKCNGGGDTAEDLVTPLQKVLSLNWRSDLMYVYHVADAPTHGASYHANDIDDYHLENDKDQMLEKLCCHYRRSRINLFVLKCNNCIDIMLEKMKNNYESKANKLVVIDVNDGKIAATNTFNEEVKFSISQSFENSVYRNFRKIKATRPVEMIDPTPNETFEIEFQGTIYAGSFLQEPLYPKKKYDYTLVMKPAAKVNLRICTVEIANGAFRTCHNMRLGTNSHYIAKVPMKPALTAKELLPDIEGNIVAAHFALTFNNIAKGHYIKVLPLAVVEVDETLRAQEMLRKSKFILSQDFIPGEYRKYNNNYGWVCPDEELKEESKQINWNYLAQAFSHFTYEASYGTLIIVDIQGVSTDTEFKMTDPAIHSSYYKGRFGVTNHGKLGIMKFFASHKCNRYCKMLKLTDPKTIVNDDLAKIRATRAAEEGLKHLYEKFEENFSKWKAALQNFDPKRAPQLEPIPEETTELTVSYTGSSGPSSVSSTPPS